jgi:hypothetical protein
LGRSPNTKVLIEERILRRAGKIRRSSNMFPPRNETVLYLCFGVTTKERVDRENCADITVGRRQSPEVYSHSQGAQSCDPSR